MSQNKPTKLSAGQVKERHSRLANGWTVAGEHHLEKSWSFPDFKSALAFVNAIGGIAEQLDHHPDLLLSWGKVQATIFTHSAGGLTAFDFELAEQIDRAPSR